MSHVAIIDYGMCNLDSVRRAVEECGGAPFVTANPGDLAQATHIILPGVGAFPDAMDNLRSTGFDKAIHAQLANGDIPFLGICLGMQLMAERGVEVRPSEGLGLIPGEAVRLKPACEADRIPHMGWNEVHFRPECPLFDGIGQDKDFYFVHSYHFRCSSEFSVATTPYAGGFVSVVGRGKVFGTQFHPEKSQKLGFALLRNFLKL